MKPLCCRASLQTLLHSITCTRISRCQQERSDPDAGTDNSDRKASDCFSPPCFSHHQHHALDRALLPLLTRSPRNSRARSTALLSEAAQSSLFTRPCPLKCRFFSAILALSALQVPGTQSHRHPSLGHPPSPTPESLNQVFKQSAWPPWLHKRHCDHSLHALFAMLYGLSLDTQTGHVDCFSVQLSQRSVASPKGKGFSKQCTQQVLADE